MDQCEHDVLAAMVRRRFPVDPTGAWKRLFENDGWDDAIGVSEWHASAERGENFLRSAGLHTSPPVRVQQVLGVADRFKVVSDH